MNRDLHVYGAAVHGFLIFGHVLGVIYNLKRGNNKQAVLHAGVGLYDCWAVNEHAKELRCQPKPVTTAPDYYANWR